MKRLLKIEWLKNYSYTPVRLFTIIYFVFISMFVFLGVVKFNFVGNTVSLAEQGMFNFPQTWNSVTYFAAILKIFLALIIIFTITHEFTNKLFKQNIIDGLSKREFITSKFLTVVTLSLASTFFVFIVGLILGLTYSDDKSASAIFKEFYYIPAYFLKLVCFFSFFLFLSTLLRRSAFVIIVFIVWWIFEKILGGIEMYFRVNPETMANNPFQASKINYITDYLPLNAMSELINNPASRTEFVKMMAGEYNFEIPWLAVLMCVIYTSLFVYGSYNILKNKDW